MRVARCRADVTLIGLCGPTGAGKSTLAQALVDLKVGWEIHKFAGSLKAMLLYGFGLSPHEIEGEGKNQPHTKLGGKTPVEAMQTLGDWGRALGLDVWADMAIERSRAARAQDRFYQTGQIYPVKVAFDDVRYDNEAQAIVDGGGIVIHVDGPIRRVQAHPDHKSERGVSQHLWSGSVNTHGSKHDSLAQLAALIREQQ